MKEKRFQSREQVRFEKKLRNLDFDYAIDQEKRKF